MEPLRPLALRSDLRLGELLDQMSQTSFGARSLGHAWHVLKGVWADRECGVVLTASGALSVARLGGIFGTMIENDRLHAVVTTGAVITHQMVLELGLEHFKVPEEVSDAALFESRLYRIYDSIERESNLDALTDFVRKEAGEWKGHLGSADIVRRLAEALPIHSGWLGLSAAQGVPVFAPALADSELGLALYESSGACQERRFQLDPMVDLDQFAAWLERQKRVAIITLGGGVPRNWTMQMLPYLRSKKWRGLPRLVAGIRICPDPAALGHLSGSTFSEATTWGKLDSQDLQNFAEVPGDATVIFPILILAALEQSCAPRSSHEE